MTRTYTVASPPCPLSATQRGNEAFFRGKPTVPTASAQVCGRALRRLKKISGTSRRDTLTFRNNFAICSFSAARREVCLIALRKVRTRIRAALPRLQFFLTFVVARSVTVWGGRNSRQGIVNCIA